MVMKKILKLLGTIFCVFSLVIAIPSVPAFASMGSSGGGHAGGGGSAGGGGNFGRGYNAGGGGYDGGSGSSHGSLHFKNKADEIRYVILCTLFVIAFWDGLAGHPIKAYIISKKLKNKYNSNFMTHCSVFELSARGRLFKQNQTISEFKKNLSDSGFRLHPADLAHTHPEALDVYSQAQYLYSQLLEKRYTNCSYPLSDLKKYLDDGFYKTMVKEIKLKIRQGEVDDTIVSQADVAWYTTLDDCLFVTLINCKGQDKEVQFNRNFENSFSRTQWSDYVIFGKTKTGKIKIINLIYGEHFHLNGTDYNKESEISGPYQEKHIE